MAKKKLTLEEKMEEAVVKDIPYYVPENWIWTRLRVVGDLVTGNTPSKNDSSLYGSDIPFVKPTDLNQGRFLNSSLEYLSKLGSTKARLLPKGSICICCIGATIGKVAYLNIEAATNQQINSIIPKTSNSLFIYYYTLSSQFYDNLIENSSSTTLPIINKSRTGELLIPIPPLKEQQRIVDRIESLFEKLDKAKELIEEAREGFENRKAAILEKAFRGELTKSKMIECLLKDYITTQYGYTASSKLEKADSKYLRITDIKEDYVDWINVPYCEINQKDKEKYLLFKNDIVIARTGATTGKSYLINEDVEAVFASYLIRLRIMNKNILPEYLYKFLKSNIYWKQIMELRKGIAQPGVNAEKLKKVIMPLPEIEEQKEIVRILDKLLQDESKIEQLTELEGQIELIKKSILAKAFRGELGTNCEEDESALELLKEILSKE